MGLNSGTDTTTSSSPFGSPSIDTPSLSPAAVYCASDCLWEIPDCGTTGGGGGGGGGGGSSDCNPADCASGCCCCDSVVLADTLKTRCYDKVVISCNSDGTGTGGSDNIPFPLGCDTCFESCDLLINDPDACSKISTLSWWDLGTTACNCYCKEDSPHGCLLHCATCGKCDADITVQNNACQYDLVVTPGSDCCGAQRKNRVIVFNVGSLYRNDHIGDPSYRWVKPDEYSLFQTKFSDLQTLCTNLDVELLCADNSNFNTKHKAGNCGLTEGILTSPSKDCSDCCPDSAFANNYEALLYIVNYLKSNIDPEDNQKNEILVLVHGFAANENSAYINWGCRDLAESNLNELRNCLTKFNARISVVAFSRDSTGNDTYFSNLFEDYKNTITNNSCALGIDQRLYNYCGISRFDEHQFIIGNGCFGLTVGYCEPGPTSDQYDDLWFKLTTGNVKPPTSCDCIDSSPQVITVDKRNCEPRTFDICGTTIVIDNEDISMVCCDTLGCECTNDCTDVPDCPPPPPGDCGCGTCTTPICSRDGTRLFPNLDAAIEAVWGECKAHAISEISNTDCIQIRLQNGQIIKVCKTQIEEQVTLEWQNCSESEFFNCPDCIPCSTICEDCVGNDCNKNCVGPDCCEGPDCNDCTGPDCNNCTGPDCPDCTGPDCNDCIGPDCDTTDIPPGPCDNCVGSNCCGDTGGGPDPPANIDCVPDDTISSINDCTGVKHPDVAILNNGIGLVAFENTSDPSVITIKQFKTSVGNKLQPNRKLRFGRLQNPSKWSLNSDGKYLVRLYYYETIGTIVTDDVIFFQNGPLGKQAYNINNLGIDEIGDYIEFIIEPKDNFKFQGSFLSKTDDRYDIQWLTYDHTDIGLVGSKAAGDGIEAELDLTPDEINELLSLSPHYFNGQKVPVAYPKLAISDNYDNSDENAHFVYVVYQALENSIWKVYLRQLRLSEYKKSADVLLENDNIHTVSDAGITTFVWTCRATCITYDCDQNAKSATITSIWTAQTTDGLDIYNCDLRSGSNIFCGQQFPKNILTLKLSQTATSNQCPTASNLQDWKLGDIINTPLPVFISDTDQSEIDAWANSYFSAGIMTTNNMDESQINAQFLYTQTEATNWCIFTQSILTTISKFKGIYASDPILISDENTSSTHPKPAVDYNNKLFIVYSEMIGHEQNIVVIGTETPENYLPIGTDSRHLSNILGFDSGFKFFFTKEDFLYRRQVTYSGLNQHPDIWIDLNNVVHICWQSNIDKYWEIYYAQSDDEFTPVRITDYQSRSLKPCIRGDNHGNLVIVWHDDRFGVWEIMGTFKPGSRVRPLFQQNEYLSSIINNYHHTVNFVPFTVQNNDNISICISDIVVNFFQDRNLTIGPYLSVKKSNSPFAFTQITGDSTFPSEPDKICIGPGESIEFQLTLTPEVFV